MDDTTTLRSLHSLHEQLSLLRKEFREYQTMTRRDLLNISRNLHNIVNAMKLETKDGINPVDSSCKESKKHDITNTNTPQPTYISRCNDCNDNSFPRFSILRQILEEQKRKIHEEHMAALRQEKDQKRIQEQCALMRKNRLQHEIRFRSNHDS